MSQTGEDSIFSNGQQREDRANVFLMIESPQLRYYMNLRWKCFCRIMGVYIFITQRIHPVIKAN